jgi:hypothetical protein
MAWKSSKADPIPKEHWERDMDTVVKKETPTKIGVAFEPMKATKRTVTYNKTNECDH